MCRNLLFMMSISGSMVFLLYVLVYPVIKRRCSLRWRYRFLKITAVFYLVPFSEYKYQVVGMLHRMGPHVWKNIWHLSDMIDTEYMVITRASHIEVSPKLEYLRLFIFLSGCFTLYIIWKQVVQYLRVRKVCFCRNENTLSQSHQEMFLKIKEEMHVKQKVKLIRSEYFDSPLTGGILSPVIVLPAWDEERIDKDSYEYIIKHELTHIKNHDVMTKFLGVLVMALHWFNPISYFFFRELSCICEMCCDSEVIAGKGEEDRDAYGDLLLELSSANNIFSEKRFGVGMASSRSKKIFKRRILEMRRETKHKRILAVVMSGIFCIVGGITAFAYIPPATITVNDEVSVSGEIRFSMEDEMTDVLLYNNFFTDTEGNIYELIDNNMDEKAGCSHSYVSGTVSQHERNSNGGCTMSTYYAERCVRCGDLIWGALKNIETNLVCPH